MLVKKRISKLGKNRIKAITLPKTIADKVGYGEEVYLDITLIENTVSLKCNRCSTEWSTEREGIFLCPKCNTSSVSRINDNRRINTNTQRLKC
jgi:Zn finger protein HypA/HybF involved in hydrogenase expression